MIVGYARISTDNQNLSLQVKELEREGCERIFTDIASGGDIERKGLNEMINFVRDGDTVVCCKTDRIARDTIHALSIADQLKDKGVGFKLLDLGDIDLNSTMGRAIYTIVAALAQAERERIKERIREGLVQAKAKGKTLGRPTIDQSVKDRVSTYRRCGLSIRKIAEKVNLSVGAVHKIIKEEED